jgi:hypothetical protein
LTGIQFPLTNFPHVYQTWESEEDGFQENEFLETNKALINQMPTQTLNLFSSYEFFLGTPNYSKLKVFGCQCYHWLCL